MLENFKKCLTEGLISLVTVQFREIIKPLDLKLKAQISA